MARNTSPSSARNARNSRDSPWRKMVISRRSAECHEHFARLAESGDTRKIPRPELDNGNDRK